MREDVDHLWVRGNFLGRVYAILFLGWVWLVGGEVLATEQGSWTVGAPAPTQRTEVAVAAVGETIYVVGGFSQPSLGNLLNFAISPTVEAYDPSGDRWTQKAALPMGLHHAAAAELEGTLYIVGGFTKSFLSVWNPVNHLYRYDPTTDEWASLAPMPTARGALAAVSVKGKLYAIGGYDGEGNAQAVEVYDPPTNSWEALPPLLTPRDHLAAALVGERLYVIGGRVKLNYHRNLGTVEEFDISSRTWRPRAPMPTPRSGIAAGVIHDRIYVVGGESEHGTFEENERYDPHTNTWQSMASLPTARHGLGAAVFNDRLYVISGGTTPGGSFSNLNEIYAPPPPAAQPRRTGRTPSQFVGAVMAILAILEQAQVLPPESTPEANQIIRSLIQFQSAFLTSANAAVNKYFSGALASYFFERANEAERTFRANGWTSEVLEAILLYNAYGQAWEKSPELLEGFKAYNLTRDDFDELQFIFDRARRVYIARGQDIHDVFRLRRQSMPGASRGL